MRFELEKHHRNVADEDLLADLRRIAAELKQPSVTTREYNAAGRFHSTTIMERFGGWTSACSKAGLIMRLSLKDPAEEELLRNIEEVWTKLGRQPRFRDIRKPFSRFTTSPYLTRYDTWENALSAFVTYVNDEQTPQSEDAIRDWKVESTTKHKTSRTINLRLRVKVWMRDNHKCQICGRSPATDSTIVLHVDHIKAWANGGETVLENLQTLCSKCNLGKSDIQLRCKMSNKSNQHPQLTGSEILWATLVGEGVTTVFGYPGGAILPAYDALRKFPIHHFAAHATVSPPDPAPVQQARNLN
jgi:5-methylcytosine-specific restriction endonuclease McrA